MIAGHLFDLPAAHAVRATVADVPDVHFFLAGAEQTADDRRAHAVELARASAAIYNLAIRDADPGQEPVLLLGEAGVEMERPGEILGGGRAKEVDDGFGGQLAGHVTGSVTAHAVGNDVQRVVLEDGKAILVVVPLQPYVGDASGYCTHG